jgi:Cd2+/Zn2+-exporting ATPase
VRSDKSSCDADCSYHGCGCAHEHDHSGDDLKKTIVQVIFSGLFVLIAVLTEYGIIPLVELQIPAALAALALTAYPIIKGAVTGLIRREWNVCELAALALVAAVIIGEFTAAAEIAFILTIGELVEEYLYSRTKKDLNMLVQAAPTTASIIENDIIREISVDDIKTGDLVVIHPGERVPVDGLVKTGVSDVDESFRTGESLPIKKNPGDAVYSGSINLDGALVITTSKPASLSSFAKVVELVQEAGLRRPPSHPVIDRFAGYYTPVILAITAIVSIITWDIVRGITVLIVSCPCAILLATPSAVLAAIGPAAKRGILIKSGKFLEICRQITIFVFDKTGTLTSGEMKLTSIHPEEKYTEEELLTIAATVERSSPHPIAKSIIEEAGRRGIHISDVGTARHIPGKGIEDTWNGMKVLAGTREFLEEHSVSLPMNFQSSREIADGNETEVLFSKNGEYIGKICISDVLHSDTKETFSSLRRLGDYKFALLTGDNRNVAKSIAEELNIPGSMTFSGLLPEDKEAYVARLQENGEIVCFIGDGINDGPALVRADLGVGIGSRANTLALESSGVILMGKGLSALPSFIQLGKKTTRTIMENIGLALFLNMFLIIIAAYGIINPVMGAIGHQVATMAVLFNSIRLSRYLPE